MRSSWSRRDFLRVLAGTGSLLATGYRDGIGATTPGVADESDVRIGFVTPPEPGMEPATEAALRGVELGVAEARRAADLLDREIRLSVEEVGAPPELASGVRRLVRREGVHAVIGGIDGRSRSTAAGVAEREEVLFLEIGGFDAGTALGSCRPNTFSLAGSVGMYADALADHLVLGEDARRWYFVVPADDVGAYRLDRSRRALEERGGEVAGVVRMPDEEPMSLPPDLASAAPDVVFLALEGARRSRFVEIVPPDADYVLTGLLSDAGWSFPGSVPPRGIWPTAWDTGLFRYGAAQLNDRFEERFGRPAEPLAWSGWLAVKVVWEAVLGARSIEATELTSFLEGDGARFDGHKGRALTFRSSNHRLRQPVYVVRPDDGETEAGREVVAEVPDESLVSQRASAEPLDRIGDADDC